MQLNDFLACRQTNANPVGRSPGPYAPKYFEDLIGEFLLESDAIIPYREHKKVALSFGTDVYLQGLLPAELNGIGE